MIRPLYEIQDLRREKEVLACALELALICLRNPQTPELQEKVSEHLYRVLQYVEGGLNDADRNGEGSSAG